MTARRPYLSVVIPFYDEEANVAPLLEELMPILRNLGRPFEVVAVNDGSRDATWTRLLEGLAAHPEVRALQFSTNHGQTAAFEAGFRAARGELIATLDGDLQIDPRDLPLMVKKLEEDGVDLVFGWRKDRQDGFVKRASTRIANTVRNWMTGEQIPDTGCPLKVFRREVLQRMKLFNGMHRFFITLAHMDGYRSSQMIVGHRPRRHGVSKYGVWNRVFRALRDCLVVRWMMSRHLRYDVEEVASPSQDKAAVARSSGVEAGADS